MGRMRERAPLISMQTYGMLEVKEDLRALEKRLVALGANEGQKTLQRVLRKAFAPVLEAARANVPVDSGLTRDNLKIATQRPQGGDTVASVGLRVGKSREKRPSRHGIVGRDGKRAKRTASSPDWRWHFIEGGTAHTPARPFLAPALDANAQAVVDTLSRELGKEIDATLKRQQKKKRQAALLAEARRVTGGGT